MLMFLAVVFSSEVSCTGNGSESRKEWDVERVLPDLLDDLRPAHEMLGRQSSTRSTIPLDSEDAVARG